MKRGMVMAAGAYVCWGLLPLYWKALHGIGALEILAHRMVWSLVFVLGLLLARREIHAMWAVLRQRRIVLIYTCSALLLSLNWFIYIWSVNAGHVVEASLGYFINPLVNVVLGVVFLHERLRRLQMVAVGLAAAGVVYLTIALGTPPWIALVLALTFGTYGLIRKTAALESLQGLTLETFVLFPFALGFLLLLEFQGKAAFGHQTWLTTLLLAGAGVVTATPLLLFAAGARQVSMTTLGLLQYIAPTLQFLLGVLVYHEPITPARLVGFGIIWLALAIYTLESYLRTRQTRQIPTANPVAKTS